MSKEKQSNKSAKPIREAAYIGLPAKITELLEKESDRGVILILATYYEEILGLIINAGCTSPELADKILGHRQPAGDFDSRILVAHAFGFIHEEDVQALRIVQRIRNKAAHFDRSGRGFDGLFDSPATADQVVAFSKLYFPDADFSSRQPGFIRYLFVSAGRILSARLMSRLGETRPGQSCKSAKEKANEVRERTKETEFYQKYEEAIKKFKAGDDNDLNTIVDAMKTFLKSPEAATAGTAGIANLIISEVYALKQMHIRLSKSDKNDTSSNETEII